MKGKRKRIGISTSSKTQGSRRQPSSSASSGSDSSRNPMLQRTTSTTASDHQETDLTRNLGPIGENRFPPEAHNSNIDDWNDMDANAVSSPQGDRIPIPTWEYGNPSMGMPPSGYGMVPTRGASGFDRVVGVYFDKQRRIWRANWREGGVGKRKTKNFSVDDFGFEEARLYAIQYRLHKMSEVANVMTSQPGISGGPPRSPSMDQTELLGPDYRRVVKSERKSGSDPKGKRRRKYAPASIQLTSTSPYSSPTMPPEYYAPQEMYTNWCQPPPPAHGSEEAYYQRTMGWRNSESAGSPMTGAPPYVEYPPEAYTSMASECGPPMWPGTAALVVFDDTVLDGTNFYSPRVVSARPPSGDSSELDIARASSDSLDGRFPSSDNSLEGADPGAEGIWQGFVSPPCWPVSPQFAVKTSKEEGS